MDYIINKNPKLLIGVNTLEKKQPVLEQEVVAAYSRALRKIKVKGGWQ